MSKCKKKKRYGNLFPRFFYVPRALFSFPRWLCGHLCRRWPLRQPLPPSGDGCRPALPPSAAVAEMPHGSAQARGWPQTAPCNRQKNYCKRLGLWMSTSGSEPPANLTPWLTIQEERLERVALPTLSSRLSLRPPYIHYIIYTTLYILCTVLYIKQ